MKKRIMIFGGSMFINEIFKNKEIKVYNNTTLTKLKDKFLVDNFSNEKLTVGKSLKLLNAFANERNYSDCILALGEADMKFESVENFKNSLLIFIDSLKQNNIRPLLVSLPKNYAKDSEALAYQKVIDEIAESKNVEYIYNGETSQTVSYKVYNNSQMKKALLNLCR